ncbi:hypothetical protein CDAR_243761 [Caerostris darwini]|uniref:Uncharacterized protein n=1 Tax=Caerostris darwini TaxID=1538125 RepID=A0AAV4N2C2_9ARAC|nr:hypothetical protein CDAR_243761 [Caerostris darwini]
MGCFKDVLIQVRIYDASIARENPKTWWAEVTRPSSESGQESSDISKEPGTIQHGRRCEFCRNMINLIMDSKQRKLNTLILQGALSSRKTYIAKSITKTVILYGYVSCAIAG